MYQNTYTGYTILGYIGDHNIENNNPATTIEITANVNNLRLGNIKIHHDVLFSECILGSKDTMEKILPLVNMANKEFEANLFDFKIVQITAITNYFFKQI